MSEAAVGVGHSCERDGFMCQKLLWVWAILVSGMVLCVGGYCGFKDIVGVGHSCEWDGFVCLDNVGMRIM